MLKLVCDVVEFMHEDERMGGNDMSLKKPKLGGGVTGLLLEGTSRWGDYLRKRVYALFSLVIWDALKSADHDGLSTFQGENFKP